MAILASAEGSAQSRHEASPRGVLRGLGAERANLKTGQRCAHDVKTSWIWPQLLAFSAWHGSSPCRSRATRWELTQRLTAGPPNTRAASRTEPCGLIGPLARHERHDAQQDAGAHHVPDSHVISSHGCRPAKVSPGYRIEQNVPSPADPNEPHTIAPFTLSVRP
jgi:hypothetical protein